MDGVSVRIVMSGRTMRILQVHTTDGHGGAAQVVWNLHHAYRQRGLDAIIAVGYKSSDDPRVVLIPNETERSYYTRLLRQTSRRLRVLNDRFRGLWRLGSALDYLVEPQRRWNMFWGIDDYNYPGTWRLLDVLPSKPDIVHCHNLHATYFDLRALPWLSRQIPVVLTLQDAWLLSGHCAHSFECQRWKTGCGHCPDLSIYPAIRRDGTAYNWRRKQGIYAQSRLHVATPCRWLMDKVEESILAPALVDSRIITPGVDQSIFRSADTNTVRRSLGVPTDAAMLLLILKGSRSNVFLDYQTMRTAIAQVSERLAGQHAIVFALGEDAAAERIGKIELRFVPRLPTLSDVARYYQAADVFLHAATDDTFPNVVMEALACGTPVVATAVGGIPEQIKGLAIPGLTHSSLNQYGPEDATGVLVPRADARSMALVVTHLLQDELLRRRLSENAAEDAKQRFDLEKQADAYLAWYEELRKQRPSRAALRTAPPRRSVG
jgi:glycosyltransferase involved in cell wall biosynthesis